MLIIGITLSFVRDRGFEGHESGLGGALQCQRLQSLLAGLDSPLAVGSAQFGSPFASNRHVGKYAACAFNREEDFRCFGYAIVPIGMIGREANGDVVSCVTHLGCERRDEYAQQERERDIKKIVVSG